MLAYVLIPTEPVLAASMQVANERGPSKIARDLVRAEQETSVRAGEHPVPADASRRSWLRDSRSELASLAA